MDNRQLLQNWSVINHNKHHFKNLSKDWYIKYWHSPFRAFSCSVQIYTQTAFDFYFQSNIEITMSNSGPVDNLPFCGGVRSTKNEENVFTHSPASSTPEI